MGVGAIEALFCISHFASCSQLSFAHQATLLLLLPLKGLFVCVSWRPVCLAHVKMPGGPGQGGLAQVWAAVHPQHLPVGVQCSSVSTGPCSRSSPAIWFSMAFYPSVPPHWACLWKPSTASPQEKSFPSSPYPSIPYQLLWWGRHPCGSWAPAWGSEVWLETCLCSPLSSLLHRAARAQASFPPWVFSETKGPFLGTVPRHSSEVLASLMALRASSQGLFMTLRLLGVVK